MDYISEASKFMYDDDYIVEAKTSIVTAAGKKANDTKVYPNTAAGAMACLQDMSAFKKADMVKAIPDPRADGVWKILLKPNDKAFKAIVYLAGAKIENNDFETIDITAYVIMHFAKRGDKSIVPWIEKVPVADIEKVKDEDGYRSVHHLAMHGVKEILKLDPKYLAIREYGGWTPLHHLARLGFKEILKADKRLLRMRCDDGNTPEDMLSSNMRK